jgi:hypothetical protein
LVVNGKNNPEMAKQVLSPEEVASYLGINTLPELSRVCKLAAKARIPFMTLFPSFQVIGSGCCTVAAQV